MAKSPHVIFRLEYVAPTTASSSEDQIKRRNFYTANAEFDALDYFSRKNAAEKHTLETSANVQKIIDRTDMDSKDIINYASKRPGATGFFDANGDLDKADVSNLRSKLKSTKSTVWSSIISFTQEYGLMNCNNAEKAQKMLSRTVDNFFDSAGLDPKNITWCSAYHMNTDNPHLHLIFFENEPTTLDKRGASKHHSYKLPSSSFDVFKSAIAYEFKENKFEYHSLRDSIRKSVIHDFKKDSSYNEIKLLKETLPSDVRQFARLENQHKDLIRKFCFKTLNANQETKGVYDTYIRELNKEQISLVNLHKNSNIEPPANIINFASSRIDDLHSRLFNATLKEVHDCVLFEPTPMVEVKQKDEPHNPKVAARERRTNNKKSAANSVGKLGKFLRTNLDGLYTSLEIEAAARRIEFEKQKERQNEEEMER